MMAITVVESGAHQHLQGGGEPAPDRVIGRLYIGERTWNNHLSTSYLYPLIFASRDDAGEDARNHHQGEQNHCSLNKGFLTDARTGFFLHLDLPNHILYGDGLQYAAHLHIHPEHIY